MSALGARAAVAQGLTWSGTFHGVGARLLREYADLIGLAPTFTINDREDSADLMNLVRHELGLSAKERRFPAKGTCFAIYSRVVNTGAALADVLDSAFPWCREWEADLRMLFAAYVEAKQKQSVLDYDDLLLYWSHDGRTNRRSPPISSGRFDHVLVDEYQDTNRLQASILLALEAGRPRPDRGRRRRPVDLFVSRRDGAQHPRFSDALQSAREAGHARAQLPLHPADSGRIERGDRTRHRTLHEEPLDRQGLARSARVS